jgi:membrane protein implicated in regulation of membrane protease activity
MRITLCLLMMASVAMLKPPLAFIVSWIALIGIAAAAIAVWWRWSGRRLLRQLTQRRLQRLQSAEAAAAVEQREEAEREDAVPLSHLGPGQQRA